MSNATYNDKLGLIEITDANGQRRKLLPVETQIDNTLEGMSRLNRLLEDLTPLINSNYYELVFNRNAQTIQNCINECKQVMKTIERDKRNKQQAD